MQRSRWLSKDALLNAFLDSCLNAEAFRRRDTAALLFDFVDVDELTAALALEDSRALRLMAQVRGRGTGTAELALSSALLPLRPGASSGLLISRGAAWRPAAGISGPAICSGRARKGSGQGLQALPAVACSCPATKHSLLP